MSMYVSPPNVSTGRFRCEFCEFGGTSSTDLNTHYARCHFMFRCQGCLEVFGRADDLQRHMMHCTRQSLTVSRSNGAVEGTWGFSSGGKNKSHSGDDAMICPRPPSRSTPYAQINSTLLQNTMRESSSRSCLPGPPPLTRGPPPLVQKPDNEEAPLNLSTKRPEETSYSPYISENGDGEDILISDDDSTNGPASDGAPKTYNCPYCQYSTQQRNSFDGHLIGHSSVKPFECTLCDYKTKWRTDIKLHMKRHHKTLYNNNPTLVSQKLHQIFDSAKQKRKEVRQEHLLDLQPQDKIRADLISELVSTPDALSPEPVIEVNEGNPASVSALKDLSMLIDRSQLDNECFQPTDFNFNEDSVGGSHIDEQYPFDEGMDVKESRQRYKFNALTGKFKCISCKYETGTELDMGVHQAGHENFKPFQCKVCSMRFNFKLAIRRHLTKKHMIRLDLPSQWRVFTEEEARNTISQYNKTMGCTDSKNTPKSDRSATREAPIETSAPTEPTAYETTRLYRCDACKYSSQWVGVVRKHINAKHGDSSSIEVEHVDVPCAVVPVKDRKVTVPNDVSGERVYKCGICRYKSNWYSNVFRHSRTAHPNSKENILVLCPLTNETQAAKVLAATRTCNPGVGIPKEALDRFDERCVTVYRCKMCPHVSHLLQAIKVHCSAHGNCRLRCKICKASSNHPASIRRHIIRQHATELASAGTSPMFFAEENPEHQKNGPDETEPEPVLIPAEDIRNGTVDPMYQHLPLDTLLNSNGSSVTVLPSENMEQQESADDVQNFGCKLCDKTTRYEATMKRHISYIHKINDDGGAYVLSLTEKTFESPGSALLGNIQSKVPVHRCVDCPFKTHDLPMMVKHRDAHTPGKKALLQCRFCTYRANYHQTIKKHAKLHPESLEGCQVYRVLGHSRSVVRQKSNGDNLAGVDGVIPVPPGSKPVLKPGTMFRCCVCPFNSKDLENMERHVEFHASNRQSDGFKFEICTDDMSERGSFKCPECPYVTGSRSTLRKHIKFHGARFDAPHTCPSCNYCTAQPHHLSRHMLLHSKAALNSGTLEVKHISGESKEKELIGDQRDLDSNIDNESLSPAQEAAPPKISGSSRRKASKPSRIDALMSKFSGAEEGESPVSNLDSIMGQNIVEQPVFPMATSPYDDVPASELTSEQVSEPDYSVGDASSLMSSVQNYQYRKRKSIDKGSVFPEFYECDFCPFRSRTLQTKDDHLVQHGARESENCHLCNYSVKTKFQLFRHYTSHHRFSKTKAKQFIGCEPEPDPILDQDYYRRCKRPWTLPPLAQSLEKTSEIDEPGSRTHSRIIGDSEENGLEETIEEEMVEDEEYNKENDNESKRHLIQELIQDIGVQTDPASNNDNVVQCESCPFIAQSEEHLRQHMIGHSIDGSDTIPCIFCGWSTQKINGSEYYTHLKTHMHTDFKGESPGELSVDTSLSVAEPDSKPNGRIKLCIKRPKSKSSEVNEECDVSSEAKGSESPDVSDGIWRSKRTKRPVARIGFMTPKTKKIC